MFRPESFQLFGLIGSAVLTTVLLRRSGVRGRAGQGIIVTPKEQGLAGVWPMLIVLAFALLGTCPYGVLRNRLPP
ncbi:hypothetical protein DEIPH_ctg069orf0007 [Deinococcus phoenicis]|uniref:Uncharacterized protein n=1 Tax=Deinococcus phoenicis TaxID=1476583 RepID=A0A016QLD1_9DEIO|nr:hypothetical protein [Deinococcus phoenicis]EYB66806.1 hypothetical protein DEIPH_ctg069orf0007 [Deinococcus phoenicis]